MRCRDPAGRDPGSAGDGSGFDAAARGSELVAAEMAEEVDLGGPGGAARNSRMIARETAVAALASERFDLVVIGGGITGAGVALDAASRGLTAPPVARRRLRTAPPR